MASQKPFKTHRQQLRILRERNMSISDGSKAIRILKREGYYNIINGYKDIFLDHAMCEQHGEDYYKDGVTFDHIFALYDFDRTMRNHLIKCILKAETDLKTKTAYAFSEAFPQNFSYLDINNYDASDPQKVTKLIARISAEITMNSQPKDQGGQIYHYLNKYKELPLWVLINKLTFGEAYHFFAALQRPMKEKIMDEILDDFEHEYHREIQRETVPDRIRCISNMIDFMNQYRNICAHDERLYNTVARQRNGKILPIMMFHHIPPLTSKSRLFDCIVTTGLFVTKRDYQELIAKIEKTVGGLDKKLPHSLFNSVLIQMGFSKEWKEAIRL